MAVRDALLRPLLVGAVATVVGSAASTAFRPTATALGLLGYLIGAVLIGRGWTHGRHARRFGVANSVTLARLIGSCWIVSLIAVLVSSGRDRPTLLVMSVIAGAGLILDGVDGRLARGRGEASSFGARFDIEVDAATTLILAIAVPAAGIAGWWVIIMGTLRYAYLAAGLLQPALRRPLPFSQSRRVIGMAQAVLLVISLFLAGLSSSLADTGALAILPGVGLLALLWSFGRDAIRQLHN